MIAILSSVAAYVAGMVIGTATGMLLIMVTLKYQTKKRGKH